MGGSSSTLSSTEEGVCTNSQEFYKTFHAVKTGSKELIYGGVETLSEPLGLTMSTARKNLIKSIAKSLSEDLNFSDLKPEGKTIDQIVEALKKYLPNPHPTKGNNKTWSA